MHNLSTSLQKVYIMSVFSFYDICSVKPLYHCLYQDVGVMIQGDHKEYQISRFAKCDDKYLQFFVCHHCADKVSFIWIEGIIHSGNYLGSNTLNFCVKCHDMMERFRKIHFHKETNWLRDIINDDLIYIMDEDLVDKLSHVRSP